MTKRVLVGLGMMSWVISMACVANVWAEFPSKVSFKEDVAPLLEHRCGNCHEPGGSGTEYTGLLLNSYAGVMKGSKHGPVVVPGATDTSELLLSVAGKTDSPMPHNKRTLTRCEFDLLRAWIAQGAPNN
ncbi:MAG: hypothetical protein HQL87_06170 [Magnetococcales bacterium]|nr:hypothetical protein [Magnetococcales bacterium]